MRRWRLVIPRLALGLTIGGAATWLMIDRGRIDPVLIERFVLDLGPWGPVGHIAIFAIATILFVPGIVFSLAGGLLFGPIWGTVYNLTGATIGATAAFLVGRYIAGDEIRRRTGRRLGHLIAGVEAEGSRFIAFVRLVPLFPFNLSNYALGLTRISLKHYVLATAVCMAPGALAYTWMGFAGREAAAGNATAIRYGALALALLAAVAFLPRLLRQYRVRDRQ
jgi:uncharacterized membrane protein YdjX (TVP38/TMEM64 family)